MIRAYLTGRSQCVCVDGVASDSAHITSEVPQGSVLGPLLFCLFMNDITEVMKHCKYHIYADDVHLYISGKYNVIGDCVERLNDDLAHIYLSILIRLRLCLFVALGRLLLRHLWLLRV
jgi:hypothetical protein